MSSRPPTTRPSAESCNQYGSGTNPGALHSSIGFHTPVEFEEHYYRQNNPRPQPLSGELALH
jgi:hypothetical protein